MANTEIKLSAECSCEFDSCECKRRQKDYCYDCTGCEKIPGNHYGLLKKTKKRPALVGSPPATIKKHGGSALFR